MTEKDFINFWIEKISKEIKIFPDDFLVIHNFKEFESGGRELTLGSEFFGTYEIIWPDGTVAAGVDNFTEAKYYFYASLGKPYKIRIPISDDEITKSVQDYELYLDSLLKQIKAEFEDRFPDSKRFNKTVNQIFNDLNLKRY